MMGDDYNGVKMLILMMMRIRNMVHLIIKIEREGMVRVIAAAAAAAAAAVALG